LLPVGLSRAKHPEQAEAVFHTLLDKSADRAVWHARFADVYRNTGYKDDAVRELRLATQLDPKITATHHPQAPKADLIPDRIPGEATGSTRAGASAVRRERQEKELRTIVASALNDLGTAEARQQQFSLALAHLHDAEDWDHEIPGLQHNIGIAAMRASNYAGAVRALQPVVAANPGDRVARVSLGSALFATSDFSVAQKLAPLGPETPWSLAVDLAVVQK
jgi:predicted Zn-dependent protease